MLAVLAEYGVLRYVPERRQAGRRRWADKSASWTAAVCANRQRVKGARGKEPQRGWGEKVKRSCAHARDIGAMRRTTLRGVVNVHRRTVVQAVAVNLGMVLRAPISVGTPKRLAKLSEVLLAAKCALSDALGAPWRVLHTSIARPASVVIASSGSPQPAHELTPLPPLAA